MKRKVNRVGQNTLTISLPSNWVKQYSVKQGDELEILEQGKSIMVGCSDSIEEEIKEISIEIDEEHSTHVRSMLGALYRKGYDIIRVRYYNEDVLRLINESVNNLIGFEVMEHNTGSCVVQSILKESEDEFYSTLNKMLNVVKTMSQVVSEDYSSGNYSRLEEAEGYRQTCWKLRDYAMRILVKKKLFSESSDAHSTILWTLEKINRDYKRVYAVCKRNNFSYAKKTGAFLKSTNELLHYFVRNFYTSDISKINEVNRKHKALRKEGQQLICHIKERSVMVHHLLTINQRIQDMSSSLIIKNL